MKRIINIALGGKIVIVCRIVFKQTSKYINILNQIDNDVIKIW